MKILVLNSGSSSVKYQLIDMPDAHVLARGSVSRIGEEMSRAEQSSGDQRLALSKPIADHEQALSVMQDLLTDKDRGALHSMHEIEACGHRVVHGGECYSGSIRIDNAVLEAIEDFSDLAPLHNPPNLQGIRTAMRVMGSLPQVASFDTAFHRSIPEAAYRYALPLEICKKLRIRKYGFHGISHRWVTERAALLLDKKLKETNLITCHLGNGCSITAVKNGMSVDTSMGFTPLSGLMMGTRTGDIDPAVVFYLSRKGWSVEQMDRVFNKESGLLGISGTSNDMRDLDALAGQGNSRAGLALDMFAYRIRKTIGAYLAVLNGCDAIVFTGGIGERNCLMRARILDDLDALGIILDAKTNVEISGTEGIISSIDSRIPVFVVPTDEEAAIARDTYKLITGRS